MAEQKLIVALLTYTSHPVKIVEMAIRNCRSDQQISQLLSIYEGNTEELIKKCIKLGHTSVLEHASYTFGISGFSRSGSHQLVRTRMASYAQKSQRHVNEGNFGYVIPDSIRQRGLDVAFSALMGKIAAAYEDFVEQGVPKEDARYVLPNACTTQLIITLNTRALYVFLQERLCRDAQWEIQGVARQMLELARGVASELFPSGLVGPKCATGGRCPKTDCPGPIW